MLKRGNTPSLVSPSFPLQSFFSGQTNPRFLFVRSYQKNIVVVDISWSELYLRFDGSEIEQSLGSRMSAVDI